MSADETTALVPSKNEALAPYEPKTYDQAVALATAFAKSGLLPELNTPERVLLVMAKGAELQIPPTAALSGIHIIKGKPSVSADLKVALCLRRRDICEYFKLVSTSDTKATYETKRRGQEPRQMDWTIEMARRARLTVDDANSNWGKYPAAMLRHRCSSELATAVYPDIVTGLITTDEAEDIATEPLPRLAPQTEPGPLVLEAEVVTTPPAASPVDQRDADAAAPRQPPAAAASAGPDHETMIVDWIARLAKATTEDECQKVRREANAELKARKDLDRVAGPFAEAIKRLREGGKRITVKGTDGKPIDTGEPKPCPECGLAGTHVSGCPAVEGA